HTTPRASPTRRSSDLRHAAALRPKSHVIPYPVPMELVETARRYAGKPRRIAGPPVRLLAIGRLVPYKGLDGLIRSLPLVRTPCRDRKSTRLNSSHVKI